ncbi:MAG: nucleoside diphosphate kinase regulator [Clostridiales bacterium]|nr:nucleoside diphosphate kinase regulator [Clostridiales bacterium]
MSEKHIYITDNDMKRLRELILVVRQFKKEEEKYLQELEAELDRAEIVKANEVPPDVITMNSEVHLRDLETEEEISYKLVFPEQADAGEGRISVLAPIGTALLGYRVGNIIEWKVPAGVAKLRVEKIIYQPEAHGRDI